MPTHPNKADTKTKSLLKIQDNNFFVDKIKRSMFEISRKLEDLDKSIFPLLNSDVRPIHCDTTSDAIDEILHTITHLGSIIEQSSLQLNRIENKYKISISLYCAHEQLIYLQSGINDLRPICREVSKRRFEVQEEIKEQLDQVRDTKKYFRQLDSRKELN